MQTTAMEISNASQIPADGCITVTSWEPGSRRRGYHVEHRLDMAGFDMVAVMASPMNITTGKVTGEPVRLLLRFGLDTIEVMP